MQERFIIVGCGQHFRASVGPTLAFMEATGAAKIVATVDIQPLGARPAFLNDITPHVIRSEGESLVRCLRPYRADDPVVILAHSHHSHAADAIDLAWDGFRVVLEKPYALRMSDLSGVGPFGETTS